MRQLCNIMICQDRLMASNSTEAKMKSQTLVKLGDVLTVTITTSSAHAAEQDTPFSLAYALKTGIELIQGASKTSKNN